ncbi:hypothetical protein TIFTF001_002530 [Ficus carica]|uniref:NB-ARC domain-containing protein n=1 Tax=Ficus carica TaxID=3494 RepID=A0AA88CSD5_FICCA|nr:hypothetical protein TIFTF001_002530 [Ficus carica]
MEVLAAVAESVPVALSLAEKALKILDGGENSEATESIETLKNMLSNFQNCLSFFMEEGQQGRNLNGNLVNNIRDLTFDIEHAIDEFMFDVPFHDHTSRFVKCLHDKAYSYNNGTAVRKLSTRRKRIEEKARDPYNNPTVGVPLPTSATRTDDFSMHQNVGGEEMVGFEKQRKDLVQQLINGDSKRATIQVVGPGGSGKTFLVNDVYKDSKIKKRFDRKAWIHMPQHFKVTDRGLLLDYMKEELGLRPGKTLQQYLEGKRYLIVLDNVWSKQDYAYIANFLPRNFTGSRVIITTRNSNVDDKPDHTHKIDGLNEEEAYTLFCKKAFPDGTCPEDLMKLSQDIIERCDRLPLAISTVGTLLSKKRPIKSEWMGFCKNIGSEIKNHDSFQFNSFLEASFVNLPSNLRSCFFYFSLFPAGHSIERGRLLRSWIGEGFLEEVSGKTMEEVAETSLNDLIARSLVRVSTLEIDGRVRSCNVLRIHHDITVHLYGKEENFIKVINEQNPGASVGKVRRLSVHHNNIAAKLLEISDPSLVRTLFAFEHKDASSESSPIIPGTTANQMKNMLHLFKLLKVLDLQGMPLNYFPKDISSFVLLRCLNLRQTNIKKVPRSIKKLSFLEILDLKYTLVTKLPKFIYKLQKLSHLLVSFRGSQDNLSAGEAQGVKVYAGIGVLSKSLQKVSLINVKNQTKFIEELGKLTQLRKLGLADIKRESGVDVFRSIQKMIKLMTLDLRAREGEYLDLNDDDMEIPHEHIQHLYLKGRLESLPRWISSTSLPSLVKVVLKGSKLNEEQSIALEALGALRNLMELEMIEYYTGKRLVFRAQMFKRLKKLHIEKFEQLLEVSLEKEALATLEKLTIRRCMQLKPLPRSYRAGHIKEFWAFEMSNDFISDIRRRIAKGEMQPDCFQTTSNHSSSTTHVERLAWLRWF